MSELYCVRVTGEENPVVIGVPNVNVAVEVCQEYIKACDIKRKFWNGGHLYIKKGYELIGRINYEGVLKNLEGDTVEL